ncbi:MAG: choice-of-anchor Q domain-containing protein [Lacunisphaera sp.]
MSGYPVRLLLLPFVLLLLLGRVLVPLRAANMTLTKAMLDDYSPTSSSGAFNTGTNVPAYGIVDDFAGTGRPQGAAYDIGAYERLASGGDSTAELAIKGDGNNVFRFLMNQNATSTTTFPANGTDVNVQWYINCSGVTKSYTRPDGQRANAEQPDGGVVGQQYATSDQHCQAGVLPGDGCVGFPAAP